MLRLNNFKIYQPDNKLKFLKLLDKHQGKSKIIAGGTDLLPNLKHELLEPKVLISLNILDDLKKINNNKTYISIGPSCTLNQVAEDKSILHNFRSLSLAAESVASPQIRNSATIGGNIALDTRCLYYNQSYFWREALGFCLKKDGDTCHVTGTGKRCVAASSNDTATVLLALNAELKIEAFDNLDNKINEKFLKLENFYANNGAKNNILEPNELITEIIVPTNPNSTSGFSKLRRRAAIDFPMLSICINFDFKVENRNQIIKNAKLVINALVAKPKVLNLKFLENKNLNKTNKLELFESIGEFAAKKCHPMTSIADSTEWRKNMVNIYTQKACLNALENQPKEIKCLEEKVETV